MTYGQKYSPVIWGPGGTAQVIAPGGLASSDGTALGTVSGATSSVKTPTGSAQWHQITGNSLTLDAGAYHLLPSLVAFLSAASVDYSRCLLAWYSANGADGGSPAALSDAANLTVDSASDPAHAGREDTSPVATSDNIMISTNSVIITLTAATTIYLVPFSQQTTSANARITVYPNALRIG